MGNHRTMLNPDTAILSVAFPYERIGIVILVAALCHLAVILVRKTVTFLVGRKKASKFPKIRSILSLLNSIIIFALYFGMVGFALKEFGVSLTAYFASATVIGLAVGFGSQGVVQDVVTGLTLVFSDLIDIDEMVEISGQVGIVRSIGMRFLVIENPLGAMVYIPNRTIGNVINYRKGYIRCLVDVTLPPDEAVSAKMQEHIRLMMENFADQHPGILVANPSIDGKMQTKSGKTFLRVKFRIWPGRGGLIETNFKQELVKSMQSLLPEFADWMVSVFYETEKRFPRR
jgi:small conductance mechanosensitive channel